MPASRTRIWPLWPALVFSLAAVHCTPGTAIGTDDDSTAAASGRAIAHVSFQMTKAPSAASAPTGSSAAKVVVPIRAIVLSGAAGEGTELFSCPAARTDGCAVDFADDASIAALFTSPIDVPPGSYDTVELRAASPSGATVGLALPSPVTLAAGEDAQIALRFAPEQLQRSFEIAALYAPRHQVDAR
jgi:hypothetical protein